MFDLTSTLFPLFFILVFGIIILQVVRGVSQWSYNNKQPVLTVDAKVVGKRTEIKHHNHNDDGHIHHSTSSTYYVTFEVESGDRMELSLNGKEYGQLAEGDTGKLTFQGTRYLGFERNRAEHYKTSGGAHDFTD